MKRPKGFSAGKPWLGAQGKVFDEKIYRIAALSLVLGPVLVCVLLQAFFHSDPVLLLLVLGATAVTLLPMLLYGVDLYTLLPIIIFLRYEWIALIAKTALHQPLQTFLSFPFESYALSGALLLITSVICLLVRWVDNGRVLLRAPLDVNRLRKLAWWSAAVGLAGSVMGFAFASRTYGIASTSSVFPIATSMQDVYPLCIVFEALYNLRSSNNQRLVSGRLLAYLTFSLIQALAGSARILFVDSIVALALVVIMQRAVRVRYVVSGIAFITVFFLVISPIVLGARAYKNEGSTGASLSAESAVAVQALTDPEYLQSLKTSEQGAARYRSSDRTFDYYGNQSNILNRLSWVALVDQIYTASYASKPIGGDAVTEAVSRLVPRFLFPDKSNRSDNYSDYLSYKIGIEREGTAASLSFPLCLEGFAIFGPAGFVLFSVVGFLVLLFVFSKISSWRGVDGYSLFFYTFIQTPITEGNSVTFLGLLTRGLPLVVIICVLLDRVSRRSSKRAVARPDGRPARHSGRANGVKIRTDQI